jgi:hypothetical protein
MSNCIEKLKYILNVMKMADFVTKLQNVLRPKEKEAETITFRKGKRLSVPAKDVERIYQHQRKRVVQVTYTGPKNLPAGTVVLPFSHLQTAGVVIRNTTQMPVSRKRTGSEKRQDNKESLRERATPPLFPILRAVLKKQSPRMPVEACIFFEPIYGILPI